MRVISILIAVCFALGLVLAWSARGDNARAQEPTPTSSPTLTPTPHLLFEVSSSPVPGVYVTPGGPIHCSIVVSNVGETEAGSVVVELLTTDLDPISFVSTQGTCTWAYGPDYHGYGSGECDLGALPPPGGPEPSSATIDFEGDSFWNFYSSYGAAICIYGPSFHQVLQYPFGTPTPTYTPTSGPAPVGGVVLLPELDESGSSGGGVAVVVAGGIAAAIVVAAAVWFSRKRWLTSK
jgi:hypothetical protein